MPTIKVGDINLYYEVRGQGDPLLMIYGLGGNSANWEPRLLARLEQAFRLIVFDNRGAGRSDKPDVPYSIEMFADDTAGLLRALELPPAHVFGISMGGMIAQELALRHPAMVRSLTLGCTSAGGKKSLPPPPEALAVLNAPREGLSDEEIVRRGWPFLYTREYLDRHRAELEKRLPAIVEFYIPGFAYKRQLDATFTLKTYERLDRIRVPTLVVTGAQDGLLPAANSELIAAAIPGAKLHMIEHASHLFFNEKIDEFLSVFLPFLAEC